MIVSPKIITSEISLLLYTKIIQSVQKANQNLKVNHISYAFLYLTSPRYFEAIKGNKTALCNCNFH